jgi:hypothetical protein
MQHQSGRNRNQPVPIFRVDANAAKNLAPAQEQKSASAYFQGRRQCRKEFGTSGRMKIPSQIFGIDSHA